MNKIKMFAMAIVTALFSIFAFALPGTGELRVMKETPATKQHREGRSWSNMPANAWYASKQAKEAYNLKDTAAMANYQYAGPGYVITVEVTGVLEGAVQDGTKFPLQDRMNNLLGKEVAVKKIPGGFRIEDLEMGPDGTLSVKWGDILDKNKPFIITIWPKGWTGTGLTWNAEGKFFRGNYDYRKNNDTVLPEMYSVSNPK